MAIRLSHVNITMPPGHEDDARAFYGDLLMLPEIPKPEPLRTRGGVWFDAGGLDIHVSADPDRDGHADQRRHFGLSHPNVEALRVRLDAAGVRTENGRPAPWKRFFAWDPFGNRIEIHDLEGFRE